MTQRKLLNLFTFTDPQFTWDNSTSIQMSRKNEYTQKQTAQHASYEDDDDYIQLNL